MNPGDEILRILGEEMIHAGVILERHKKLMNPGDEILRILGGKIHLEQCSTYRGTNIPTYRGDNRPSDKCLDFANPFRKSLNLRMSDSLTKTLGNHYVDYLKGDKSSIISPGEINNFYTEIVISLYRNFNIFEFSTQPLAA